MDSLRSAVYRTGCSACCCQSSSELKHQSARAEPPLNIQILHQEISICDLLRTFYIFMYKSQTPVPLLYVVMLRRGRNK